MDFNQQRGAFVSEPAILVRRVNSGSQVWSMEKLENKLIDMREMYQEYKERIMAGLVSGTLNFFFISNFQETNHLQVTGIFANCKAVRRVEKFYD